MKLKTDYRVAAAPLAKVKADQQAWAVVEPAWDAYAQCPDSQRATLLKRFTPGQRAFVAILGLEAEVNNGGIHQFLWNSTGDLFPEALAGLELIGAKAHVRLLQEVAQRFADPKVFANRRRRQTALKQLSAAELSRLFDDPFYRLERRKRACLQAFRLAYLKQHPEEFVRSEGQSEEEVQVPKPGARDYRVPAKKVAKARGEKLHWALIEKFWDDYWEPLKRGRQEILDFLPALSRGQRALIAIDILNKTVLRLGGFHHFLGTQVGADVLAAEVAAGFQLLGAKAYAGLFERALQAGGALLGLNRQLTDASGRLNAAKKAGDEAALQAAREAWRAVFDRKRQREDEVAEPLEALTEECQALLEARAQPIEPFIEAYFDAHPDEFVR